MNGDKKICQGRTRGEGHNFYFRYNMSKTIKHEYQYLHINQRNFFARGAPARGGGIFLFSLFDIENIHRDKQLFEREKICLYGFLKLSMIIICNIEDKFKYMNVICSQLNSMEFSFQALYLLSLGPVLPTN